MAFAFQQGEPLDLGARRLAREGSELVLSATTGAHSDVAVHEARRTLKRLRALVRLIGPAIGDRAREANAQLRAAGHAFAGTRDAAVMLKTFDQIAPDGEDAKRIRTSLRRARSLARIRSNDVDAVEQLRAFAASIDEWSFDGGWSTIEPGTRRTFRQGRRALRAAIAETTELHELRKRVKDLQFQLTLIRAAWPEVIGGYLHALKELGSILGDENDLAMLDATLARKRLDTTRFRDLIDRRRRELRSLALPLASKLYVDKPRVWSARLGAWWNA